MCSEKKTKLSEGDPKLWVVYGASHHAGQLGETGPPRPFYAAQSGLIPALKS
jgi:hypothetical protein